MYNIVTCFEAIPVHARNQERLVRRIEDLRAACTPTARNTGDRCWAGNDRRGWPGGRWSLCWRLTSGTCHARRYLQHTKYQHTHNHYAKNTGFPYHIFSPSLDVYWLSSRD